MDPKTKNVILWVCSLLILVVLFIGFGAFDRWISWRTVSTTPGALHEQLVETNPEYVQARERVSRGELDSAKALFQVALLNASTPLERGRILFQRALIEDNPAQRITLLKEVVAYPQYSVIQKAFAVEEMGRTYDYNIAGNRSEVFDTIFSESPYKEMFNGSDREEALFNLYQYAVSFYPLAMSQYHTARYLAEHGLLDEAGKDIIGEKIQSGDEHLAILEQNPDSTGYLWRDVYTAKGNLLAVLANRGISDYGRPEEYFMKASSTEIVFRSAQE